MLWPTTQEQRPTSGMMSDIQMHEKYAHKSSLKMPFMVSSISSTYYIEWNLVSFIYENTVMYVNSGIIWTCECKTHVRMHIFLRKYSSWYLKVQRLTGITLIVGWLLSSYGQWLLLFSALLGKKCKKLHQPEAKRRMQSFIYQLKECRPVMALTQAPCHPLHTLSLPLSLPLSPLHSALAGTWPRLPESQHVFTTLWMCATLRALPAIWMLCNINNWCSWGVVIKLVNYAGKITCNYETGGYV